MIRLSNEGIRELFSTLVFLSQCRGEENKAPRMVSSDLLLAGSPEGELCKPFPAAACPSTHRLRGRGAIQRARLWGSFHKSESPAGCQTLQSLGALSDTSLRAALGPGIPPLHLEVWAAFGKGRNSCSELHFQPFVSILGRNINYTESFRGGNKPEPFETNHFVPVQPLRSMKGWEVKI